MKKFLPSGIALWLVSALLTWSQTAVAQSIQSHIEVIGGVPQKLVWESQGDQSYDLWYSSDLGGWTHVDGYPQSGVGGPMEYAFIPGTRGFFKIIVTPAEFVLVPAGAFEMGDKVGSVVGGDGASVELPVHTVTVSAFHMARHHVTQELWDEVREWGLSHAYPDLPVGSDDDGTNLSTGPTHPVHMVSWFDALKWCNARSERDGRTPCYRVGGSVYRGGGGDGVTCDWGADGYRLPTEAEWEKAARGGQSNKRFPWGDTISHSQANYTSPWSGGQPYFSYDVSPTEGRHPDYYNEVGVYTSPVGSFAPNGYGLYDMAGNVRDWCWDRYDDVENYYEISPDTDPRGPASGPARIVRGGSFVDPPEDVRCASRRYEGSSNGPYDPRTPLIGFRLARSQ